MLPSPESHLQDAEYESAVESIRKRIVAFATAKVGNEVAEDIAQGCLLLLMQRYPKVRDRVDMLRLSITIARNKMFEHFRQTRRQEELPETIADQIDIHRELERRQVIDRVLPAMLLLDERCRQLLQLKLFENKGAAEIQKLLGINSINTIYTWESRCFKQLMVRVKGTLYVAR
jgi:RNA polymerase sigma-70 factor (ECF subfamily)